MRIAGIDPGTIQTGVGVVEDQGKQPILIFVRTIQAGQGKPLAVRLDTIYRELCMVFEEWKPEVVALETVFYQKDFKAAVKVGEARAAAMLAATKSGIPVVEYPPARIKQSVCGNGRASKEQIQYMVRQLVGVRETLTPDVADAVAVALCYLHTQKFVQIRKELSRV